MLWIAVPSGFSSWILRLQFFAWSYENNLSAAHHFDSDSVFHDPKCNTVLRSSMICSTRKQLMDVWSLCHLSGVQLSIELENALPTTVSYGQHVKEPGTTTAELSESLSLYTAGH